MQTILVTGGAGFIGSAVVRRLVGQGKRVVNLDKLTYAGNVESLNSIAAAANHRLVVGDVCDAELLLHLMRDEQVDAIMHLAAESHVDRSIDGPAVFVETNVVGTFRLLEAALEYWKGLDGPKKDTFRFHHVSTDEVFGDLPFDGSQFVEGTPYAPSSPYSASKAASDHFVRAWHHTYGLPVVLSNCSNTYGPYQFPEKLIPAMILNAIEGKLLPVFGEGDNVRDWLYIEDHVTALIAVLTRGRIGQSYNIGGNEEHSNLEVVEQICQMLDERQPTGRAGNRRDLITFVTDRPGHDRRYSINTDKIESELGCTPKESFSSGLAKTIAWYLENEWWWGPIRAHKYGGERLGSDRA